MEVLRARQMGFCFGVRRAIELMEKAAHEHGQVQSLGAIVHNRQVVERLAGLGVRVVAGVDDVQSGMVAITSHGAGPGVAAAAQERGLALVDATCPFVQKVQQAARALSEAGFAVIVFGEAQHPEVRGILGWAGPRALAVQEASAIESPQPLGRRLGIVSQTTQNPARFAAFVKDVIDLSLARSLELRVVNTICNATSVRQKAALELARQVDLVLVVGGRESANTRRLAETCAAAGVETHHVESAAEIEASWLAGHRRVGVTAGASTPGWIIDEVVRHLEAIDGRSPGD